MFPTEENLYLLTDAAMALKVDPNTLDTTDIVFPGAIGGAMLDPEGEKSGVGVLYGFYAINLNYFLDSTI